MRTILCLIINSEIAQNHQTFGSICVEAKGSDASRFHPPVKWDGIVCVFGSAPHNQGCILPDLNQSKAGQATTRRFTLTNCVVAPFTERERERDFLCIWKCPHFYQGCILPDLNQSKQAGQATTQRFTSTNCLVAPFTEIRTFTQQWEGEGERKIMKEAGALHVNPAIWNIMYEGTRAGGSGDTYFQRDCVPGSSLLQILVVTRDLEWKWKTS